MDGEYLKRTSEDLEMVSLFLTITRFEYFGFVTVFRECTGF